MRRQITGNFPASQNIKNSKGKPKERILKGKKLNNTRHDLPVKPYAILQGYRVYPCKNNISINF